MLYKDSC